MFQFDTKLEYLGYQQLIKTHIKRQNQVEYLKLKIAIDLNRLFIRYYKRKKLVKIQSLPL